jgi:voltage-gated potassium channel Kch
MLPATQVGGTHRSGCEAFFLWRAGKESPAAVLGRPGLGAARAVIVAATASISRPNPASNTLAGTAALRRAPA